MYIYKIYIYIYIYVQKKNKDIPESRKPQSRTRFQAQQTQCQVKRCRTAGHRNTRSIELSFKIGFYILSIIFESTLSRFFHPKLHPVCDICFPGDSREWNFCMLWSMTMRGVIHAETFVQMRIVIDIRFVRYVVAAAAGLLILKGPQDHFQKLSHLKLI